MRFNSLGFAITTSILVTAFSISSYSQTVHKSAKSPSAVGTSLVRLDYNRDVRPILAAKCFACHGSDEKARQAGLRLDLRSSAVAKLSSGKFAITPGNTQFSEIVLRINTVSPTVMPPAGSQKTLNAQEKQILTRWIAEGAEYKLHWAFIKPVRPLLPSVHLKTWPRNGIDNFILARLEKEGLKPSPEADRPTLIRRLSLDLIGIPPTPAEVDDFVADRSPNAYETLVDRLLSNPHYGERMALSWLDGARYADSNGYQADYERFQWRWRDWVLDAYNNNMPFDEFTVEQLAGDMLPNATMSQRLATGFNRNHRINTEGGAIAEEWRVETVIDRVETTSAVWLGLTMGCGRCHDHKYDPITQKEFYQFCSFFNNVPETGIGQEAPINHPPIMRAPTVTQQAGLAILENKQKQLDARKVSLLAADAPSAAQWIASSASNPHPPIQDGLVARYSLANPPQLVGGSAPSPKTVGAVSFDRGRIDTAVVTNGTAYVDLGDTGNFDTHDSFSYGAWAYPTGDTGVVLSRMDSKAAYRGWDLYVSGGKVSVHLISQWMSDALKVTTSAKIPNAQWSHLFVTYDGSAKAAGVRIYINGILAPSAAEADSLKGTIRSTVSAKIGTRTGSDGFNGRVEGAVIYGRALTGSEVLQLSNGDPLRVLLAIPADKRTPDQSSRLAEIWSERNDPEYKKCSDALVDVARQRITLDGQVMTAMVMEEMPKPRDCFVLVRGQYDKHGDPVTAGLPAAFPPMPTGSPMNRLGLARWIVSPDNPLTARVAVNRFWEKFFGTGIVATSEDFGTRAEFPSHPELLDWLATEFVRLRWDMKAIQKEIVMSAAYRQSSKSTPELIRKDPLNRLISRGPRYRLPAEEIRDQALAVSGLLVEKVGGPSVRPYQPEGIWDETNVYGNLRNYKHDTGESLYRRSIYTIWKRTAAPPTMTLFDVPGREACRVRRTRTDTPLQALVLLNETTFVEAARVLAQRALTQGGPTPETRVKFAFRSVLARNPSVEELRILITGLKRRLAAYKANPASAEMLATIGDYPREPGVPTTDLAAYTLTASILLNMDETINKE